MSLHVLGFCFSFPRIKSFNLGYSYRKAITHQLTRDVWLHESKTAIKATKCCCLFPQTPAGVTLTCDLRCRRSPNQTGGWDCVELGEVGLVNQSFSHCSAYTAREFTGGSTLPSRGVWNPVCLPHSADPTAPGRGNVFSLLLKKKVPASVCLCAWTQNALTDHLSHFEITIIKALRRVRRVDRESVHHGEEMEEERGLFFLWNGKRKLLDFPRAWPAFAVEYVRQERNGSAGGGLRHLRNHRGATFQGRNLHFVFLLRNKVGSVGVILCLSPLFDSPELCHF